MPKSEQINRSLFDKDGLFLRLFGPLLTEAGAWGAATPTLPNLRPCVRMIQSPRYILTPWETIQGFTMERIIDFCPSMTLQSKHLVVPKQPLVSERTGMKLACRRLTHNCNF